MWLHKDSDMLVISKYLLRHCSPLKWTSLFHLKKQLAVTSIDPSVMQQLISRNWLRLLSDEWEALPTCADKWLSFCIALFKN